MLEKNLKYAIIIDHRNKFNTYLISKDAYLINEDGDRYWVIFSMKKMLNYMYLIIGKKN